MPLIDINLPPGSLEEALREGNIDIPIQEVHHLYDLALDNFQEYIDSERGQIEMKKFMDRYNTQPSFNFAVKPYHPLKN